MKVSELITRLQAVENKDRVVVLSRDCEGNGYSELYSMADDQQFSASEGEIGMKKLTDAAREAGFGEEDVMAHGEPAVVLWPGS